MMNQLFYSKRKKKTVKQKLDKIEKKWVFKQ